MVTPPRPLEDLDIEWTALNHQQQENEVLAAIKHPDVIQACQSQGIAIPIRPPLPLPDDDLSVSAFAASTTPALIENPEEQGIRKIWVAFVVWWATKGMCNYAAYLIAILLYPSVWPSISSSSPRHLHTYLHTTQLKNRVFVPASYLLSSVMP